MNLKKSWVLKVDGGVYKKLQTIPEKDRIIITQSIESLSDDPYYGDIRKIKDESNSWRRRVGSYRIFYDILEKETCLHITRVERRTSSTYS